MASIFEIERRKNFVEEFTKFFEDLKTEITIYSGKKYTVLEYLNHSIRYWPYRCGATSIDDYLKAIKVDITAFKNDTDFLLTMELLINLLYWAVEQEDLDSKKDAFSALYERKDVESETERMISNAEYILEQCCNMKIRKEEDDEFPKYYITKRNATVDSASVSVPELADVLLGYYDIRNVDNIEAKKVALTTIYGYMEPHRKEYKSLSCGTISEEFFISINTFGIRHNTKSQKRIAGKKKSILCDKLFAMEIYVLQTPDVNTYKAELKMLREK